MAAGQQMPRRSPFRHVEIFGQLAHRLGHVAILAMLPAERRLVEILSPFEEGLGLFADDTRAHRMAIRAGSRGSNGLVNYRFVGRVNRIRPPDLPLGREMTRSTGNTSFLMEVTGF